MADVLSRELGSFYRNGLLEAKLVRNPMQQEKRHAEIQTRYGEPALRYALLGKNSSKTPGHS